MRINHLGAAAAMLLSSFLVANAGIESVETQSAQWIAPQGNTDTVSTWMCLQREFKLDHKPTSAVARIAADSKYWLWINGKPVVLEGGVKRGPNPKDSYVDQIDLAPYLKKGKNLVSAMVWYYGKKGFSYNPSGKAAFLIGCPEVPALQTDGQWSGTIHPAYYIPDGTRPNYRLSESNIGFDARKDIQGWESRLQAWPSVVCRGVEGDGPWGALHPRVIPMWKDYGLSDYVSVSVRKGTECDTLVAHLPYNGQMMPAIDLEAPAGSVIGIMTDNYMGGSEPNVRAEYVTRKGSQHYENKGWMNGENIWYIIPKNVKVKKVQYRETGYDTEFAGSFECNDNFYNRLWQKALRTLYVTMRDNYMDCPDRERAQWWGDEVNESGESFYALSPSSHLLMKKGMHELIGWQRPDGSIYSPVPSGNWSKELPGQMLASIGYYGFWNYYMHTGDLQTIAELYPGVKRYMSLWKKAPDGTIADRDGGWHWGDWGSNIDKIVLYNGFYYLAQKGMLNMAKALGKTEEADSIAKEMSDLKEAFNRVFWTGKAYRHPQYKDATDDRVQALAVVSGLADAELYPALLEVFRTEEHASPYTEKYVDEALFIMGEGEFAMERMKRRFADMVNNPDHTTLLEGWEIGSAEYGGGTTNHAWSGGGLTLLSQYVCGIAPIEPGYTRFKVSPCLSGLTYTKAVVPTVKGDIGVEARKDAGKMQIILTVPAGTTAIVDIPTAAGDIRIDGIPATPDANSQLAIPQSTVTIEWRQ